MKSPNPVRQNQIVKQLYISINDIYELLPIGRNQAAEIFKEIEKELKEQGVPLFNTRPRVIPTKNLLEKYPQVKRALYRS